MTPDDILSPSVGEYYDRQLNAERPFYAMRRHTSTHPMACGKTLLQVLIPTIGGQLNWINVAPLDIVK